MSNPMLLEPVELTDAELDLVAAGLNQGAFGLVAANIGQTLNNLTISALNGNTVTLTDVASHNNIYVPIGVVVAALSGATGVLNKLA
jgi:hypothetical protein